MMTVGRALLLRVLEHTRREFVAARCGVSVSAVHMWCSGARKPGASEKVSLAVNHRIPVESWDKEHVVNPRTKG